MTLGLLAVKGLPYVAAVVVAVTGIPSRILKRRHKDAAHEEVIAFASVWSSAVEALTLPIITGCWAFSSIVIWLNKAGSVGTAQIVAICCAALLFVVTLFCIGYWVVACNLLQEARRSGKARNDGTFNPDFRTRLLACKVFVSVVVGAADLCVTAI